MKFCTKCGAQITEGTKFCMSCGNPLPVDASGAAATAVVKKPINKKLLKKIIIGAVAVLVVVLVVVGVIFGIKALKKYKMDPTKYMKVEITGFDEKGVAKASFDPEFYSKFAGLIDKDLADELDDDKMTYEKAAKIFEDSDNDNLAELFDSLEIKLDKDSELKNGDKVKATLEYDEDAAKACKIVFTKTEIEVEVKDLEEIKEIDPFKGVTITWSGTAPNVRVAYKADGDFPDGIKFSYTFKDGKTSGFNVGDEVVLELKNFTDKQEKELLEKGYEVTKKSMKVTIDKADSYVTKLSDISADNIKVVADAGKEVVTKKFAPNAKIVADAEGPVYVGSALIKSPTSTTTTNLYIVYSMKCKVDAEGYGEYTMYYVTRAYSLLNKADGTFEYKLATSINYNKSEYLDDNLKVYSVYGFKNIEDVKTYLGSMANKNSYDIEFGEGLN